MSHEDKHEDSITFTEVNENGESVTTTRLFNYRQGDEQGNPSGGSTDVVVVTSKVFLGL